MNLDALLAGAMQDPRARQFLQQVLQPPPRPRALAPHPAFESAARLSSSALGDFDPMSFAGPQGPIDALEEMDRPRSPGPPQGQPQQRQTPQDLFALLQGRF